MQLDNVSSYQEELDIASSSGEEAVDDNGSPNLNVVESGNSEEPPHTFGINDILLLRKITRLFDNGIECREVLDAVINRCSALQNIRQAVLHYRKKINQQHVEPRVRRLALNRGAEYLERYFKLIAFSAYLGSEAFDGFCGQGDTKISFKTWLYRRPEIQTMKWSIRLRPGRFFTIPVKFFLCFRSVFYVYVHVTALLVNEFQKILFQIIEMFDIICFLCGCKYGFIVSRRNLSYYMNLSMVMW